MIHFLSLKSMWGYSYSPCQVVEFHVKNNRGTLCNRQPIKKNSFWIHAEPLPKHFKPVTTFFIVFNVQFTLHFKSCDLHLNIMQLALKHAPNQPHQKKKKFSPTANYKAQLSPSSFAVISVSSCKSWSTHGLFSPFVAPLLLPGDVEVVSVSHDFTSTKPITRHKTTARTGVNTDRKAMLTGVQRKGHGYLPFVLLTSAERRLDCETLLQLSGRGL